MWWNLSQAHNLLIILQQSFYKCRLADRMHQKQGLDSHRMVDVYFPFCDT